MAMKFLYIFGSLRQELNFFNPNITKFLTFSPSFFKFTASFLLQISTSSCSLRLHFMENSYHFFQSHKNGIWQILKYSKNATLNPNVSKTSRHISLRLFPSRDVSLLRKRDFFHNFRLPSFSKVVLNKSIQKYCDNYGIFDISL